MALLVTMMAMLLMAAFGAALVLTTSSETIIANNFRNSIEGLYAADAALERIVADLAALSDWNPVLNGAMQSTFADGMPNGTRRLTDGSTIDLTQVVAVASCGKTTACSDADMDRVTDERPWGANNPRWQLYAYGNLSDLVPASSVGSPYYVVVMVGDDPSELDGDAVMDGFTPCGNEGPAKGAGSPPTWSCNPGTGVITLRAEAFGPRGAHKVIEMTVARPAATGLAEGPAAGLSSVEDLVIPGAVEPPSDDSGDYNDGVGQAALRILSWREVR